MATSSYPSLLAAIESALNPTGAPQMTSKNQDLAKAIDDHVKDVVSKVTGTGSVAPGIPVVAGSPPGPGASVGPGTTTISAGNLQTN